MTAQIIPFPTRVVPTPPAFFEWLKARTGARKCYIVRRRTQTFRGVPWPSGTVLLLQREYDAAVLEYEAAFRVRVK